MREHISARSPESGCECAACITRRPPAALMPPVAPSASGPRVGIRARVGGRVRGRGRGRVRVGVRVRVRGRGWG